MKATRQRATTLLFAVSAALSVAACGMTSLTRTGAHQPPRGEDCAFQMLTAAPTGGFVELGTLDVQPGSFGAHIFTNLGEFEGEIRHDVCRAGGDTVIALANGNGMYIKATILKSTGPGGPAVGQTTTTSASGCSFDTQCKGDRVCVQGACVDAARK